MTFFTLSKLLSMIFTPSNLLVFMLLLSALGLFANSRKIFKISRFSISAVAFLSLLILFSPLCDLILGRIENQYTTISAPQTDITGIIILGGGVNAPLSANHNQLQLNSAGDRLSAMVKLANDYPNTPIYYSGGSGSLSNQSTKEADYIINWAKTQHIPNLNRIYIENQSRNTFENAVLLKKLIGYKGFQGKWLLVTSAFHMPRAVAVFKKQGFNVLPYPVDYRSNPRWFQVNVTFSSQIMKLEIAFKELIGMIAYKLTNKI